MQILAEGLGGSVRKMCYGVGRIICRCLANARFDRAERAAACPVRSGRVSRNVAASSTNCRLVEGLRSGMRYFGC